MIDEKKIIVALDTDNLNRALNLVKKLKKEAYAFKIGHELFYNFGINGYKKIYNICPRIFLDLKLHEIKYEDVINNFEPTIKNLLKIR